ncbi:MAG: multidrug effflux MFS transporter [Novosphingobium sp.]|nr:multidrug effflux MFS transporter [Novosphingobium sp.]
MPASSPRLLPHQRTIGPAAFVALMALLMSLQALAIDAMLPALDEIAAELGTGSPNDRQLVVGVFLMAAGAFSLIPGALADRFGRRPVLFVSLGIYCVLSLGCALVASFPALIGARVLQALGSAGLAVLPAAIVRDRFGGDRMARMLSTISVVFLLVPILAPSLGQLILFVADWRWIFVAMAALAVMVGIWAWFALPETLNPEYRQKIEPRAILRNMVASIRVRGSVGYVFGSALVFGAMFGFINSAQQLVGEHFGMGDNFPLVFAACAGSMAVASFTNSRIVERFGARRVSHTALLTFIAVSAAQLWFALRPGETIWQFAPLMAANMALLGFIGANFGSIAMQPFAAIAGAASSVQAFLRMSLGALIGALIGQAYDGSSRPLAAALLLSGIVALGLVLYSERGQLFRRRLPPGVERPVPNP